MIVLLIDDSDDSAAATERHLALVARELVVVRVASADQALRAIEGAAFDAVVTDLCGVALHSPIDWVSQLRIRLDAVAARVRARPPPIVLFSALDPDVLRAIAGTLVNVYALPKPASPYDLVALLRGRSIAPEDRVTRANPT